MASTLKQKTVESPWRVSLMPAGCDTVIPQELVSTQDQHSITFQQNQLKPGNNRRLRGEDLQKGKPAIAAGRLLRPSDIGLAAPLGIATLPVKRKLRVAPSCHQEMSFVPSVNLWCLGQYL